MKKDNLIILLISINMALVAISQTMILFKIW